MNEELSDMLSLYQAMHSSVDQMIEPLSDQEWLSKPFPTMNNVAAIVEHITLVERKFLGVLGGQPDQVDAGAPFKATSWDVSAIKENYAKVATRAEEIMIKLSPEELDQHAAKLGIGNLNKRQLVVYLIAHTAHHRGQIPIVKKLNANPPQA